MAVIFRYPLPASAWNEPYVVRGPRDGCPVSAGYKFRNYPGKLLNVWMRFPSAVNDPRDTEYRFLVVGTGRNFPDGYRHIVTLVDDNDLVWHVLMEETH